MSPHPAPRRGAFGRLAHACGRRRWWVIGGWLLALLILGAFAVMYLLGSNRERALAFIARLSVRWPSGARLLGNAVPAFLSGLVVLTDGRRFITAIVLMLVDWGIGVTQYTVIMQAFIPGAKLLWPAFTLGVAALGVAAPSTPGALGVFELAILGALQVFDLNPSVSLAYAVVLHIEQYLVTAVIGVYALSRDGESLLRLYQRVRDLRKAATLPSDRQPS